MHRPLGRAARLVYSPFASAWASAHCPARWAARLSQAVSVLGLQPLEAASTPCAPNQLSPKRKNPISNIHHTSVFLSESQNSPQHLSRSQLSCGMGPKDILPASKRLLSAFAASCCLMNIYFTF